jgi:hypothetical protein
VTLHLISPSFRDYFVYFSCIRIFVYFSCIGIATLSKKKKIILLFRLFGGEVSSSSLALFERKFLLLDWPTFIVWSLPIFFYLNKKAIIIIKKKKKNLANIIGRKKKLINLRFCVYHSL